MRSEMNQGPGTVRPGVAMVLVVVILVLVIAVGGGVYFVYTYNSGTGRGSTSTGTGTTSNTLSFTYSTSTYSESAKSYTGQYSYINPIGPSGARYNNKTNGVDVYNSTLSATGSFSFSIYALNQSGTGSGHGTIAVTTMGYCTGHLTTDYTFVISDATTLLGGNLTVFFGNPTPGNLTMQLSCTNIYGSPYSTTASVVFLSVYPNEVSSSSLPGTVSMTFSSVFTYEITIN
jgi:hypothetical protein